MQIRITNQSSNALPAYATPQASELDGKVHNSEPIILKLLKRTLVATRLQVALSQAFEAQIRPRRGLAYRHGITVLNSPETIDTDYRGEMEILLINLSNEPFTVNDHRHCPAGRKPLRAHSVPTCQYAR